METIDVVSASDRFWGKVTVSDNCWNWTGARTQKGYGQIYISGKSRYAHIVSYNLHYGKVPDGLEIDHLCENPSCVNPGHLEAVSHSENIRRAAPRINYVNRLKTHCLNGHELTPENLRGGQAGRRQCKICARERDRLRRSKARGES